MSNLSPVQALCVALTTWLPEIQLSAREGRSGLDINQLLGAAYGLENSSLHREVGPALPCPGEQQANGGSGGTESSVPSPTCSHLLEREPAGRARDRKSFPEGRALPHPCSAVEATRARTTACSYAQTRPQRLQEELSRGCGSPALSPLWKALACVDGPPGTLRPHSERGQGSLQPGPCFPRTGSAERRLRGGAALQKGLLTSVLICPCLAPRPPTEYSSRG